MRYYGVIGNRDYIKINGSKRPFWEFIDKQPYGYLTSLIYKRKDLPNMPIIFDCGAWSYRMDDVPKIDAEKALQAYLDLSKGGDILIAPDHMLINGVNLDFRRAWNKKQAQEFIKICPGEFRAMATLHGMDVSERIKQGEQFIDMGYRHLAIGGIAARASQKKLVISIVGDIRKHFPEVWLHVLGLSSPPYAKEWSKIGIDSFDGSSHFKQAFTAGAFFTIESGKLKKWQASRPDRKEKPTAPECQCKACLALRSENIDTREYGSNENNMGRAAHNMNMLMVAQDIAVNGTIVLVACVGKKSASKSQAKNLYQSDWFKKAKRWAENSGHRWYILSAKHGLIEPNQVIEPYEKTLNRMSLEERKLWGEGISMQLKNKTVGRFIILAGEKYREFISTNKFVETPLAGMGIGKQLAWFKNQSQKQKELFND